MDIREWPLSKIMQLPDHCFGERRLIAVGSGATGAGQWFFMCPDQLGNRFVIWSIAAHVQSSDAVKRYGLWLSLAQEVPANYDEFVELEPVFNNYASTKFDVVGIRLTGSQTLFIGGLKHPVFANGRKICMFFFTGAETWDIGVQLVISTIPNEVPDCLFSGNRSYR